MKLSTLILLVSLSGCFLFQKKPPHEDPANPSSNVPVPSIDALLDSSTYYIKIITSGKSKKWYTRPAIIDDPRKMNYSTLSFDLPSKSGSINRTEGKDMVRSIRDFTDWKIQKDGNKYVLVISLQEKYLISIIRSVEMNLNLESFQDSTKRKLNLTGYFFETPLNLRE